MALPVPNLSRNNLLVMGAALAIVAGFAVIFAVSRPCDCNDHETPND